MGRYRMRQATVADALSLCRRVRAVDRREWEDATGLKIEEQMVGAVSASAAFAIHEDRPGAPPLVIWGVDFVSNHLGQVWMAATTDAIHHAIHLHETMEEALFILDAAYPHSVAYADARNHVHLHWLERLGWSAKQTVQTGPKGLPYLQFERSADVWSNPRRRLYGGRRGKLPRAGTGSAS